MRDKLVPIPTHLFGEVHEIGGLHTEVSEKPCFKGGGISNNNVCPFRRLTTCTIQARICRESWC